MVKELDVAMQHLSDVIFHTTGKDVSLHPGAGAAGGMGGSLHAFLDAQLKPGIELFWKLWILQKRLRMRPHHHWRREIGPADSYGESAFGHLAGSKKATYSRHPAGRSDRGCGILNAAGFRGVFSITPSPVSLEQAMHLNLLKKISEGQWSKFAGFSFNSL